MNLIVKKLNKSIDIQNYMSCHWAASSVATVRATAIKYPAEQGKANSQGA